MDLISKVEAPTVKKKNTGMTGLWRLGRSANKLALSWKFMEDLVNDNIGVNEVELEACRRSSSVPKVQKQRKKTSQPQIKVVKLQ